MSSGKLCLSVLGLSMLVGCTSITPTHAPTEPAPRAPQVTTGESACGAEQVQDRIGRSYAKALGESIQQQSGAATLRVIRPGHAYTLDYRADRINVHIDAGETINNIGCG